MKLKTFPWKLYWRFVLQQTLSLWAVLAGLSIGIYFILSRGLSSQLLWTWVGFSFLATFLVTLLIGHRIVYPLGRLIRKARNLSGRAMELESEDVDQDDPGEWFELDSALNQVRRDLSRKNDRLSREHAEIEALMSAISDAILAVDSEGNVLFYNGPFAMLFGNMRSRIGEARLHEFFRDPEVLDLFQSVQREGRPLEKEVELETTHDESVRHFTISVAPLRRVDSHKVYGAVGIFHDVSELKRAEQIRIDFVGNVSHELRSPLTSIKGFADTLLEDVSKGDHEHVQMSVQKISQNVYRLMDLVNDLLDLSSIESGVQLNQEQTEIQELTEAVLTQFEPIRSKKEQKIDVHYGVTQIWADPRRLQQVLTNLIDNALKYTPAKGHIQIHWDATPEGAVLLKVSDNGPGVSAEHQSRLFERFYRVDRARSREMGGTGLGLAIVKHIVQRHGGQIQVQSQPGQGTHFTCKFPQN